MLEVSAEIADRLHREGVVSASDIRGFLLNVKIHDRTKISKEWRALEETLAEFDKANINGDRLPQYLRDQIDQLHAENYLYRDAKHHHPGKLSDTIETMADYIEAATGDRSRAAGKTAMTIDEAVTAFRGGKLSAAGPAKECFDVLGEDNFEKILKVVEDSFKEKFSGRIVRPPTP